MPIRKPMPMGIKKGRCKLLIAYIASSYKPKSKSRYEMLMPGRTKATEERIPVATSEMIEKAPFWFCIWSEPEGIQEIATTAAAPINRQRGIFKEKVDIFACRKIRGIPPVTAPIKKYMVGIGCHSMRF